MLKSTFIVNNALVVGLLALSAFFATQSGTFLTAGNVRNIAINSSILAVVVVASTMLVIAGHLDLSIGSTVGLSGVLASMAVLDWDAGAGAGIALGIAVGAGVGLINGLLCAVLGFSPIIVTLGMLGVIRGATLLITVTPTYGLGGIFNTIGSGTAGPVPVLVIIAGVTFLVGAVFLTLTPWGRYVYAIGVNPQAAYLSGLPVRALPCLLYVATGASAGLAGVLFAARLDGASPSALGIGMEISALTAILLGGVAFAGGRGTLFGVFVAVVFLGVLQNGLVLMNVQPFVQQLVQGLALVAAAGLDVAALRLAARAEARRQVEQRVSPTLAATAEKVTVGKEGA
jgi:ribose/xylose/arabinose/galactoside ABC-type transport system permease subunit